VFGRTPVIQTPKLGARIMRYQLADHEWVAIKPMLPNKPRGVPRVNDRRVLNGIFWVLRSGAPWRDLPPVFGPYTTCYNRLSIQLTTSARKNRRPRPLRLRCRRAI
jgi:transposase